MNTSAMAQAFQEGAGFSGQNFTTLILCLIAIFAVVWAVILIIGWMELYKQVEDPSSFIILRLTFLTFILTILIGMIGV